MLTRESLANIIESYAQVVEEEEVDAGGKKRKKRKQIFPRFHQLRTVRALLRLAHADGVGNRYLIQHSAGSGKSNTIAWLAHQLVELRRKDDPLTVQFDSIIVITDRRALDTQIARTIKGYDHVAAIFGHPTTRRSCASICAGARRSSSPRCRNSRSSSMSWATSQARASRC